MPSFIHVPDDFHNYEDLESHTRFLIIPGVCLSLVTASVLPSLFTGQLSLLAAQIPTGTQSLYMCVCEWPLCVCEC